MISEQDLLSVLRGKGFRLALLGLAMLGMALYALGAGEYQITPFKAYQIAGAKLFGWQAEFSRLEEVIVWDIRLPRVLLAILGGMGLAVSGAAYQGCFRNPLVEPYLLGVSSGAAFGAALGIIFPLLPGGVQILALAFGLLAVFLSYSLARNRGETPPVTLILSGVIVAAIFMALVNIMKYLAVDTQLREITFWMMGGFYYATWHDVWINAVSILPCVALITALGWKLNILSLGDEEARSLGVNPELYRVLFLFLATLSAAICVSSVGIVAWVGLMMPHAARMLFGPDNRFVVPASALLGAIYVLLCDTIARTLTQSEIPIGIITSILGAPFLIWLLRSKGKEMYAH